MQSTVGNDEEDEDGVETNRLSELRLRAEREDRPATHFVYLMFDKNDDKLQTTAIEIASNPAVDVLKYSKGMQKNRKCGKAVTRDWRLQQWVGPFNLYESAQCFQARWARVGRDLTLRIVTGAQMALQLQLAVYSMDKPKLESMLK
jgi:hypothetical protein